MNPACWRILLCKIYNIKRENHQLKSFVQLREAPLYLHQYQNSLVYLIFFFGNVSLCRLGEGQGLFNSMAYQKVLDLMLQRERNQYIHCFWRGQHHLTWERAPEIKILEVLYKVDTKIHSKKLIIIRNYQNFEHCITWNAVAEVGMAGVHIKRQYHNKPHSRK